MNITIPENFTLARRSAPVVFDVKERCAGILQGDMIVMIVTLLAINVIVLLAWKQLRGIQVKMFNKNYDILFFLPLINFGFLVFIFVYAYNAW